jgi:PRTRC genetic system protein A
MLETEVVKLQLADYVVVHHGDGWRGREESRHSSTLGFGKLYEYVFGGNGVFIRARREGLDACARVAECEIRGLSPVEPFVEFTLPKVPASLTALMLRKSREACVTKGSPVERLFYLRPEGGSWGMTAPPQVATSSSVRPEDDAGDSYSRSLVELHSHHQMDAFFSGRDDADETGFKIYAVLGRIFSESAELRVRVGVFGHFVEVPASEIFELPTGLAEARRCRIAG